MKRTGGDAMTKIKICGITCREDIAILNRNKVDYAGFVLFNQSKRYQSIEQAKELMKELDPDIKRVAVTVNPDEALLEEIEQAGFDMIQIHKAADMERISKSKLPVWLAFHVSEDGTVVIPDVPENVTGILLDAAEYGSGKSFDWQSFPKEILPRCQQKTFILAGGLSAENVVEGMKYFCPEVVDVSSSVEGTCGKDAKKIEAFIRKVREDE